MPTATQKALTQLKKMEGVKKAAIQEQLDIIRKAKQTLEMLGYRGGAKVPAKRRHKTCSICGSPNHTKRTHGKAAK
jgi:hypothetical protein